MLSFDFADIATIEIIATARIMAAIVPNSGITKVPIISISSVPAIKLIVKVLSVDVAISSKSTSSPSTNTKNWSSSLLIVASKTDRGIVNVIEPSSVDSIYSNRETASRSGIELITFPFEFHTILNL